MKNMYGESNLYSNIKPLHGAQKAIEKLARRGGTNSVNDAINVASGLTDEADTSIINLAKKITDEMVIIVYTKEEVKNSNIVNTVVKIVEKECICPNIENDGCLNTEITDNITNKGDNKLINISTFPLDKEDVIIFLISSSNEIKALGILILISKYLLLTLFISTVKTLFCPSSILLLPKLVILFTIIHP